MPTCRTAVKGLTGVGTCSDRVNRCRYIGHLIIGLWRAKYRYLFSMTPILDKVIRNGRTARTPHLHGGRGGGWVVGGGGCRGGEYYRLLQMERSRHTTMRKYPCYYYFFRAM